MPWETNISHNPVPVPPELFCAWRPGGISVSVRTGVEIGLAPHSLYSPGGWGGGGGVIGLMFAGYVLLASQSPYRIIVYFLANYRPYISFHAFTWDRRKNELRAVWLRVGRWCITLISIVNSNHYSQCSKPKRKRILRCVNFIRCPRGVKPTGSPIPSPSSYLKKVWKQKVSKVLAIKMCLKTHFVTLVRHACDWHSLQSSSAKWDEIRMDQVDLCPDSLTPLEKGP